jgi:hypothetical protein
MFTSGAILFAAHAAAAYGSLYFRIKVAAIVLAGLNALFFHRASDVVQTLRAVSGSS